MSVKRTVLRHQRATVDRAARAVVDLPRPKEGWLRTVRGALGMSGPDLAARLGQTRARVSQAEAGERTGGVTIRSMEAMARAMGCRFVYAIVPEAGGIDDLVAAQAWRKAEALMRRAGSHMALENQALSGEAMREETELLAEELARSMPADLWKDP